MKELYTKRLILRPWREGDAEDMYEYAKDPLVGPNAGWAPHGCLELTRQILKRFIEDDDTWAVALKEGGKVIGSVGIHKDSSRPYEGARMLGYVLNPSYWGKGYIPEACEAVISFAFEEMGLEILAVYHFDFNERSKRVIEKTGFTPEGIMRKATNLYDGTIVDKHCYSMTAEEYAKRKCEKESMKGKNDDRLS
ncbi:MAG: GNAT family N-acetyltransferase [Christensenellales bacterium]|jgi:ribosomal-protein-alanine N-acetyltransferase